MSVLGLDIGNANSVVAVAQRGGVDIIANEASNRCTPTLVAYGKKQQFVGESAATQQLTNLQNTIGNIKNLMGMCWQDASFQSSIPALGFYKVVQHEKNAIAVEVQYKEETRVFTPEQILASLLMTLRGIAEKESGTKCHDVVISVPFYFSVRQRRAILDSAKIAGLNPLRLINDHLASAINYGLYKIDLPEKDPRRVMIINLGYSGTQVAIVDFKKSEVMVVSSEYDLGVSGYNIDMALSNYFADEFQAKYGIDLRQHPKSWFRVQTMAAKLKKAININSTAPFYCECIYEEYDINVMMSQDKYKEIIAPLLERIPVAIQACLDRINARSDDLHSVELVGSCSRIQPLQKQIGACLGRELSFTMNAEEGVARGCALQCAILSPKFRVRDYKLIDMVSDPIEITWRDLDGQAEGGAEYRFVDIFPANSPFPASKWINFIRPQSRSLSIDIRYKNSASVIATVAISDISLPVNSDDANMCIKISLDVHGVIRVDTVELVEKVEVDEPAPAPTEDVAANGGSSSADSAVGDEKAVKSPPSAPADKKKLKNKYTPIPFEVYWNSGLDDATIAKYRDVENKILEETLEVVQVAEAKNAIEAYVYDTLNKLDDCWRQFITPEESEQFKQKLQKTADWLYEEEENQPKHIYKDCLTQLHSIGNPIFHRCYESENIGAVYAKYQSCVEHYHRKATAPLEAYSHIPPEEKAKILSEIETQRTWLDNLTALQSKLKKTDDPVLRTGELQAKCDALKQLSESILSKPKPLPSPKEKKPSQEDSSSKSTPGSAPAAEQAPPASPDKPVQDAGTSAAASELPMEVDSTA